MQIQGMKPTDTKILLNLIGKTIPDICREILGENINDKEIKNIMAEIKSFEGKSFRENAQLYKGVKDMLYSLRSDGYILGICTNGSKEYLYTLLDYFNIRQYFQIIKTGNDSLEKYQLIKQILDENANTSAIIVGDTSIDFDAAEEARCISVGVSYGYGGDSYKDSDFIANTPRRYMQNC